jgi:hypothetical protein
MAGSGPAVMHSSFEPNVVEWLCAFFCLCLVVFGAKIIAGARHARDDEDPEPDMTERRPNHYPVPPRSTGGRISPMRQPRQVCVDPLKPADPEERGGFALRGRLGRGGMGIVYYGVGPDGEQVAVKTIRTDLLDRSEAFGRFDREVVAIGMVRGPGVANLIAISAPEESPPGSLPSTSPRSGRSPPTSGPPSASAWRRR